MDPIRNSIFKLDREVFNMIRYLLTKGDEELQENHLMIHQTDKLCIQQEQINAVMIKLKPGFCMNFR